MVLRYFRTRVGSGGATVPGAGLHLSSLVPAGRLHDLIVCGGEGCVFGGTGPGDAQVGDFVQREAFPLRSGGGKEAGAVDVFEQEGEARQRRMPNVWAHEHGTAS